MSDSGPSVRLPGLGLPCMKKGPEGPSSEAGLSDWRSDAEAGGREGREEADQQQGDGGEAVGLAFDAREGHDTHLEVFGLNPGGAGLSVWTMFR